jgi:hypothetical protein
MAAGAVKPAVSYAAVAARGTEGSHSPSQDPDSPTIHPERPKGKTRESKVSFAEHASPNERTSLLRQQSTSSGEQHEYDADDDGNGDDDDEEREDEGLVARARRAVGLGKSKPPNRLPLYANDGRTQRPVPMRGALGALLGLILVGVLVAGAMLVQSGSMCVILNLGRDSHPCVHRSQHWPVSASTFSPDSRISYSVGRNKRTA